LKHRRAVNTITYQQTVFA